MDISMLVVITCDVSMETARLTNVLTSSLDQQGLVKQRQARLGENA